MWWWTRLAGPIAPATRRLPRNHHGHADISDMREHGRFLFRLEPPPTGLIDVGLAARLDKPQATNMDNASTSCCSFRCNNLVRGPERPL